MLQDRGGEDICQVCYWQDGGQDDHDADEVRGGPNRRFRGTGCADLGGGNGILTVSAGNRR
jgi:hypothetical protein